MFCYVPAIFNAGGGGDIKYHCSQYLRPVPSIRTKNGFRLISFEKISVLESNFIHWYIIIKCKILFRVKSTNYYGSYGPFPTLKNGFRSISFEKISILDSYFIHGYINIKYRSSSI